MIFGSICSGIEAASVAWEPLGWQVAWLAEIDRFASAVLQHRFPGVPNLGDFTKIDTRAVPDIDLLVGGTPCQSFSVAGRRRGLDDARGNLAIEYCRLARALGPTWVVWENVPGVLHSSGGRDFAAVLAGLSGLDIAPPGNGWRNSGIIAPTRGGTDSRGECLTLNTSECPSADVASSLSAILETGDLPQRYYLSPRACHGILRRAERRDKILPPSLHRALEAAMAPESDSPAPLASPTL